MFRHGTRTAKAAAGKADKTTRDADAIAKDCTG
jgi:hypothetical protein